MEIYRVAFIGHRELHSVRRIEEETEKIVSRLLDEKEYVEFYVGRNGDFDIVAASAIKSVQKDYGKHNSSLILLLPYSVKDQKYYEKFYDEVLYPIDKKTHYKAAITKRNEWMVDNSDMLIAYVEQEEGGAYRTYRYAKRKGKVILNLAQREIY